MKDYNVLDIGMKYLSISPYKFPKKFPNPIPPNAQTIAFLVQHKK
jgi:hypothetical protein